MVVLAQVVLEALFSPEFVLGCLPNSGDFQCIEHLQLALGSCGYSAESWVTEPKVEESCFSSAVSYTSHVSLQSAQCWQGIQEYRGVPSRGGCSHFPRRSVLRPICPTGRQSWPPGLFYILREDTLSEGYVRALSRLSHFLVGLVIPHKRQPLITPYFLCAVFVTPIPLNPSDCPYIPKAHPACLNKESIRGSRYSVQLAVGM